MRCDAMQCDVKDASRIGGKLQTRQNPKALVIPNWDEGLKHDGNKEQKSGQNGSQVRHDEVFQGTLALRGHVAVQVVHAQQHVLPAGGVAPRSPTTFLCAETRFELVLGHSNIPSRKKIRRVMPRRYPPSKPITQLQNFQSYALKTPFNRPDAAFWPGQILSGKMANGVLCAFIFEA